MEMAPLKRCLRASGNGHWFGNCMNLPPLAESIGHDERGLRGSARVEASELKESQRTVLGSLLKMVCEMSREWTFFFFFDGETGDDAHPPFLISPKTFVRRRMA